jgi:hypothetical protein
MTEKTCSVIFLKVVLVRAVKTGGMKVWLRAFLTSAVGWGGWSAVHCDIIKHGEKTVLLIIE